MSGGLPWKRGRSPAPLADVDTMPTKEPTLEALVEQAKAGAKQALEDIVRRIQHDIYRLAVKMLWHPEDAEDATQEILVRIITHLSSFKGESAFTTWVYRVAANYLLTTRKRRAEQQTMTFTAFGEDLYDGLSELPTSEADAVEQRVLVEEVKIGCTQGMLLCLDRDQRITYILSEVFELTSEQGGAVLEISPAAFRKRLSRARASVRGFMQQKCGLVNKANGCRCRCRVRRAIELGRVDPEYLLFANHPVRVGQESVLQQSIHEMEALHYTAAHLHREPDYAAPDALLNGIKALLSSGSYHLFE